MARRMIVVLSQSPSATPARRAIEEELATVLIMESGIDVNVIAHVDHLEPGSTGALCLEGIVGDMVFVSWLQPAAAAAALAKIGVTGRRGKTKYDSVDRDSETESTQPTNGRRIYFLELTNQTAVARLFDEVCRIRDDAQVQTFELAGLLPRAKPAGPNRTQPEIDQSPSQIVEVVDTSDEGSDDDEMDRLVDELDALDL